MRLLGPRQFHGIEINPFARELASMVVWIGYLQWNRANGYSSLQEPILEPLGNIVLHDALMNEDGTEYEWPEAEFIIGNPPFLGDKLMRSELGPSYVTRLRRLFADRLPGQSDFVCYWFEVARDQISRGNTKRAGLIGTNSIRGGANRSVLRRIKGSGDIFKAWSDEPWVLDGAAVRVSIVCFDDGSEPHRVLDGVVVDSINTDLTASADVTLAKRLPANRGLAFIGPQKGGPFDIDEEVAMRWLGLPNPTGASNRDVLFRYANGIDLMRHSRSRWLIDFGRMPLERAERYLAPIEYVRTHVRPIREKTRREQRRKFWWRHHETAEQFRMALVGKTRYFATPAVAKHRVWQWLDSDVAPDKALVVVAADDDYTFGVLHSRLHEVWSLAQGTWLGVGNDPRYTPSTCFETFPFPEPNDSQREKVSSAAKHLDDVRNHLLASDPKLTMTKLYNEVVELKEDRNPTSRAFPLLLAHERLDEVVASSYGWEWPLTDEQILERLLELNLRRAAAEDAAPPVGDSQAEDAAD